MTQCGARANAASGWESCRGKLCWRERCESLLRFDATPCTGTCAWHGSTGRRLRDGNFGALRAASRLQYSQRAIRTPSDKKTTEPMGRCYPPLPKAARKSIMPTLAALSLHHLQTAIAAHRSLPPSQAAITVRYCFPHLALALPDARHLRRPLDATSSTANPVCLV